MARPARTSRPINGAAVAAARNGRKLTRVEVSQLAAAAGYRLDDSNLSKIETGKTRYPGLEARLAITKVLSLSNDEMHAPCATCRRDWSAGCLNHGDSQQGAAA